MKHMKRFAAFVLAGLLLFSLAACSKSASLTVPSKGDELPATKGDELSVTKGDELPVICLGGKTYPVTLEDGVKGLEQVNDGVITKRETEIYNAARQITVVQITPILYRSDGTMQEKYDSQQWFVLDSEKQSFIREVGADLGEVSFYELAITSNGLPFEENPGSSLADFRRLVEAKGYIPDSQNGTWCRFYTENGPVDAPSKQLEETLSTFASELSSGKAQLGCRVIVRFDEESEEPETRLILTAKRERIDQWYRQWSPAFGKEIKPEQ